eukprot:CAMPEP_0175060952 /NCGR_PEP_ID=MMETSP0052_2-20121109/13320_1 /TAXON_ID=51329 ORGANISM="Polytomella parva, Strain SAG 63-3" /NCGR_SAMPLE_ID=MMETSP0052_2 /ASSEMBLY_ACC=CAM_ASM_000194 /LENGTH=587 /DNA_ID=CAMNT_0016326763 /DNA_START=55 /DNA_END=1815 /DNA_ORIENTATION=+
MSVCSLQRQLSGFSSTSCGRKTKDRINHNNNRSVKQRSINDRVPPQYNKLSDNSTNIEDENRRNLSSGIKAAVAASAGFLTINVLDAQARPRVWKPRRHYRRIGQSLTEKWAMDLVEAEEKLSLYEQRKAEEVAEIMFSREKEASIRRQKERESSRAKEELYRQEHQLTAFVSDVRHQLTSSLGGRSVSSLLIQGSVWIGIISLSYLAFFSPDAWFPVGGRREKRTGGKWVYDRSLGGKKVWVPDSAVVPPSPTNNSSLLTASSSSATVLSPSSNTPLSSALSLDIPSSSSSSSFSSSSAATAAAAATLRHPKWWIESPPMHVPLDLKAAAQARADRILKRLEAAKLGGRDYDVSNLKALREACQDGGGLKVKPSTTGAKEGIFRAAVEEALVISAALTPTGGRDSGNGGGVSNDRGSFGARTSAVKSISNKNNRNSDNNGNNSDINDVQSMSHAKNIAAAILGTSAPRFVTTLAIALQLDESRAAALVAAAAAARTRSHLLEAVSLLKKGASEADVARPLHRLAAMLVQFPALSRGAAEVFDVADSFRAGATAAERKKLFWPLADALEAPEDDGVLAALLLGFDPG